MTNGLGIGVGIAWVAVWSGLTYLLSERPTRSGRPRPSRPTMVAASGFGAALLMILVEAFRSRDSAATGMYIVLIATCGAMGWVALASAPAAFRSRGLASRSGHRPGQALGIASGPLAFAAGLVVFAGISPVDMVDWTTTHLALGAILTGCVGWVALRWTRPGLQWPRSWPVTPVMSPARRPAPELAATSARRNGFQQRWVMDRLAPRPVDRPAAEVAADALYVERGLAPPVVRVWLRSPREMTVAGPLIDDLCTRLAGGGPVLAAWEAAVAGHPGIDAEVVAVIDGQIRSTAGPAGSRTWPSGATFAPVDLVPPSRQPDPARIGHWAASDRAAPLDPIVGYQLERDGCDRTERASYLTTTRHVASAAELGCLAATGTIWPTATIAHVSRLAATCDAWRSFDGLSVFQDPPLEVRIDATDQLHAEDGPALRYGDGWSVWALHGVALPRVAVEDPASIWFADVRNATGRQRTALLDRFGRERYTTEATKSAELIVAEPDMNLRRVLIEAYGAERYVQAVGEVVHTDVDGLGQPRRLWRAERRGDDPLVMVEVRNSTPEPDGSRRTYWLRVPPQMRDCQSAVAWTFGIAPGEFVVEAEA